MNLIFKENEESDPVMGATFTKYVFRFFEPLLPCLASKFAKIDNITFKGSW
jgi:hypothetical protein